MSNIRHIDFSKPGELFISDKVATFGDGYRQVSNVTVIASGDISNLLKQARALPSADRHRAYIRNVGGNAQTPEEVQAVLPD